MPRQRKTPLRELINKMKNFQKTDLHAWKHDLNDRKFKTEVLKKLNEQQENR